MITHGKLGEMPKKALAATVVLAMGVSACGGKDQKKSVHSAAHNPNTSQQPHVLFDSGVCVKFAVQLAEGEGRQIADTAGENSYFVANLGQKIPDKAPSQKSLNTARFKHAYSLKGGSIEAVDYVYDFGIRDSLYKNGDRAHVEIQKMEDDSIGVTGWTCHING